MNRGCEVAVKKLRVSRMSAKAIRDFHGEVVLMRTLRHPNIVLFMGLVMDPVCLVTEYCHNGNFMAAVTTCRDFGAQKNKVSHCFPIYFP